MTEITEMAADKGIQVGAENRGRLLGRTTQPLKIVQLVNKSNFGLNIDFTNFQQGFGEDQVEAPVNLSTAWSTSILPEQRALGR